MRLRLGGVALALGALAAATLQAASGPAAPQAPDAAAARVVQAARRELGDGYVYGGNGPDRWDCSGLTSVLWRTIGGVRSIPRTSRQQQAWAWPVAAADARPGDLVFFGDPVTHVGLYLGSGRMLDASSARRSVVERAVWSSDVVRYGRVPRSGVRQPSAPKAPAVAPRKPAPEPVAAPVRKPAAAPRTLRPVPKPGHRPGTATTKAAAAFVARARSQAGLGWKEKGTGPAFDAAGLVRWSWWKAGFGVLPDTSAAIEARTRPVSLANLAVGDLIFYGGPAVHVGIYVGNGQMVDASKVLRKVVLRSVFASETVRFARLVPPRR